MRIGIVGGGPAGLFLATLLRRQPRPPDVAVYDRNPPGATYGFGVVFSERTLEYIARGDPETCAAMTSCAVHWDDIELRVHGRRLRCGGHGFSAIARSELLRVLQERADTAGAQLNFEQEASAADLDGCDVVVIAEGAQSSSRQQHEQAFGTSISVGEARFIWFGTTQRFDALTMIFRETEHGAFGVHAYPFADGQSTFIVETDANTWQRAGLDACDPRDLAPGESDTNAIEHCRKVFAEELGDHELLANNSKWLAFPTVRNQRWSAGNAVLIGDAAHTAHFSVGSGTKMAMEDAIALAQSLEGAASIPEAFEAYEAARRPGIEHIQEVAEPSRVWWERFGQRLQQLSPERFAFHFHTRTGMVSHDSLRMRDRRFVRAIDEATAPAGARGSGTLPTTDALDLRGLSLANRIVVTAPDSTAFAIGAMALAGAGLVMSSAVTSRAQLRQWCAAVQEAQQHLRGQAVGLSVAQALALDDEFWAAAHGAFELLDVHIDPGDPATSERFRDARRRWPESRPLAAHVTAPPESHKRTRTTEAVLAALAPLRQEGCLDLVTVSPRTVSPRRDAAGIEQLLLCDAIRNELGVPVAMAGGVLTIDDARTQIEAGRADLCWGRPQFASPDWAPEEEATAEQRLSLVSA
ncbi:MAG: FAD-dependent monooxygenase [Candidatus Dormibacteraeota bacterium]|nr:FAD-dependent monooxygenase [Candidatus Dormibacteraeota bacterium]MBV9525045.1 FAD-dependent monooxygenase [Candidatus Dormibacteraeota bacterium]